MININKIHCGDSMDVMKDIDSKSIPTSDESYSMNTVEVIIRDTEALKQYLRNW